MPSYNRFVELEQSIGYTFSNKELLERALTHPSVEGKSNYERLEFLGDAVLELSITEFLYKAFPDYSEGDLTKIRASVVCSKSLSELAMNLGVGRFLILGKGEEISNGRNKTSILENAMEAILGAIFLDSDYKAVRAVIYKLFQTIVNTSKDYKTLLQEVIQKKYKKNINYKIVSVSGPVHNRVFTADVFLDDIKFGSGCGKSKKEAEQCAAKAALGALNIQTN